MPATSGLRSMKSNHVPLVVLRCKIVIVGDAGVGKTALTQVFHSGGPTFPKNYMMTVGAEFLSKQVPIPNTNAVVELYIFDCAGQSIFNQLEMNSKYVCHSPALYAELSFLPTLLSHPRPLATTVVRECVGSHGCIRCDFF